MRNEIFIFHAKRNMLVICDKQQIRTWIGEKLKQGKFKEHFVGISIQVSDCRFLPRFDPCISLWSSLDVTIATDSLAMFQIIFLVSCPVSWGPSHASSWCPLERATWLTWFSQDCKGTIRSCTGRFQNLAAYSVPVGAIEGLPSLWSATAGQLYVPAPITLTIGPWTSAVFWVFSPTAGTISQLTFESSC